MPFELDESRLPIVILKGGGRATEKDLDRYHSKLEQLLAQGQKHVIIWDIDDSAVMPPHLRSRLAKWLKDNRSALKRYRLGYALVSDSAVVRGFYTAVFWTVKADFPRKTFKHMEEALAWGERLVQLPPSGRQ